jgi:hypothetical protein
LRAFFDTENGKVVIKVDFDDGESEMILEPRNIDSKDNDRLIKVTEKLNV